MCAPLVFMPCCLHWSNMAEVWPVVCHNMAAKPRPVSLAQVVAPLYKMNDAEKHPLHSWNYYTVAAKSSSSSSSSSSRNQQFTARYMQKCTVLNCSYYLPSQSWCTAELHKGWRVEVFAKLPTGDSFRHLHCIMAASSVSFVTALRVSISPHDIEQKIRWVFVKYHI